MQGNGRELPGFKKKSFSMYFGGGEIWFEHLDGIYKHSDLVIEKLQQDYQQFKLPSAPSLIAFNLDETLIDKMILLEIVKILLGNEKRFTKVVFVGVSRWNRMKIEMELGDRNFALAFINDFEKAKEWLIADGAD